VLTPRSDTKMDSMRSLNTGLPGTSPAKQTTTQNDSPEQLLDAFKAAALSVTKLYKTSAAAQTKARIDGYQECLDDLLAFLDKENIGLGDGEGWRIRRWATERLDGRDYGSQTVESDDEAEKAETSSTAEVARSGGATQLSEIRSDRHVRTDSAPPTMSAVTEETPIISVPSQDTFTFQSSHPYPQDASLNLANLDLSDTRSLDGTAQSGTAPHFSSVTPRTSRTRHNIGTPRSSNRSSGHVNRMTGQKRKLNFAEIFDLASLGYGKDVFGNGGGKRSRHA
jgi:hypothetical protein